MLWDAQNSALLPLLDASIILHWQECTPQGLTVHSLPLDLEELERGCLPTVIRAMMQQQITEDHNVTKKRSTNERMGGLFDLSGRTFRRIWRPSVPSPIAWQSFVHIITALGIGYSIRFGGQPDEIVICKH